MSLRTRVVALALSAGAAVSSAQIVPPLPARDMDRSDPPILEDAGDPQLPPPRLETSPPNPLLARGFGITQVNVDGAGMNIRNDAANEPSIAIDPTAPNRMVIGWRQFDNISSSFRQAGNAWSNDGGRTWHNRTVLTPGVFRSDPVLEADAGGRVYYSSLKDNFLVDTFTSADGGMSWSGPIPAYGGDKQWIVIDRTGGQGHGFL
ncbi:MAG: hypothetical protein K8E66_04465, partial [Phycisphaerales bacterium]|nr:hypothetical protein [Phycisphaerales bacterium]